MKSQTIAQYIQIIHYQINNSARTKCKLIHSTWGCHIISSHVQHNPHHKNTPLKWSRKKYREIVCSYCNSPPRSSTGCSGHLKSDESLFYGSVTQFTPIRSHPWHTGIQPLSYKLPPLPKTAQSDWNHTPTDQTRVRAPHWPIIQRDATDYGLKWVWLLMGLKP